MRAWALRSGDLICTDDRDRGAICLNTRTGARITMGRDVSALAGPQANG